MKFIHIADLHLGRRLSDISLIEDQRYALNQVLETALKEKTDAVFIAGDIYDKASPTSEAMSLFNDFITEISRNNISVYIISGNHDSEARIIYFSELIREAGIYTPEKFNGKLSSFTMTDEYGDIVINLLPFLKPVNVRNFFPDKKISTYEDAVKSVIDNSNIDRTKRNILICHQFITGAELCDSEQLAVGGLDNISAKVFDDFDYVALGHIHKPQKVVRDTLRYSGSLLKYSLSEAEHKKSITIVEMHQKGNTEIKTVPIKHLHDVREVKGSLSDIMKMNYSEDYVKVTITDEDVPPDARVTLSTVFPNMIKYAVINSKTKLDIDVLAKENVEDKTVRELFRDFYKLQNNDIEPPDRYLNIIDDIMKNLEENSI